MAPSCHADTMATFSTTSLDTIKRHCHVQEPQQEEATTKCVFYDINNPPDAEDQFAMFPNRAKGNDNLAYVLMKMEGSTEYLPLVFCTDCAAPKVALYCNGGSEYLYEPCSVDKDFYCPKFYAELMRRICLSQQADAATYNDWAQLLQPPSYKTQHAQGCVRSSTPDFIIQGKEGVADSIYFRHCGGEFRNVMMQKLELETMEDAMMPMYRSWAGLGRFSGPHNVPGLEWNDTTGVKSVMFVEGITHL